MDAAVSLERKARSVLPEAVACQDGLIDGQKVILGVFFVDGVSEPVSSRQLYYDLGGSMFCNAPGYQYMLNDLCSAGFLEEAQGGGMMSGVLYRKGPRLGEC